MKRFLFGLLLLVGLFSFCISPVQAQQSNNQTQVPTNESVIQIDEYVRVSSYELPEDSTVIEITVHSDQESRPMKLTDMYSGKGKQGAYKYTTKTVQLAKGENTVTMELTPKSGRVEVSLATFGGTVGIAEGTESNLFQGDYSGESVIFFSIISAFVAITSLIVVAFRREDNINNSFTREL